MIGRIWLSVTRSVVRRPNRWNAWRTRSRSASEPWPRKSSCAREQPRRCVEREPRHRIAGIADELRVRDVRVGELAREVGGERDCRARGAIGRGEIAERTLALREREVSRDVRRRRRVGRDRLRRELLAGGVIAPRAGQLRHAHEAPRPQLAVAVGAQVVARGAERRRSGVDVAAQQVDLAEAGERLCLAPRVGGESRRIEGAHEVQFGAIGLAAPQQRDAHREIDARAWLGAAERVQLDERVVIATTRDQLLRRLRLGRHDDHPKVATGQRTTGSIRARRSKHRRRR
jgi:hypothetical protein